MIEKFSSGWWWGPQKHVECLVFKKKGLAWLHAKRKTGNWESQPEGEDWTVDLIN